MRRLYVTKLDVALEAHGVKKSDWKPEKVSLFNPTVGWHAIHLIDYTDPAHAELMHTAPAAWEQLPEVKAWRADGSPILLSSSFDHSEWAEEQWHGHPDVAILPHPTFEGNDHIKTHVGKSLKKLTQQHLDALKKHKSLQFDENDTIHDLSRKARAINPQVMVKFPL